MKRSWINIWSNLLIGGLLMSLASCEMKDELWGKKPGADDSDGIGVFDLKLEVKKPSFSGTKSFSEELIVPDVESFGVKVFKETMELQEYFASYADLRKQSPYQLKAATYYVEACSGENYEVTFDKPYYEMEDTCVVKAQEVTSITSVCELRSALIQLVLSDLFKDACLDDYAITITNGTGVLTIGKDDPMLVYVRPGEEIRVTVRATKKEEGTPVFRSFILKGVDGSIQPQDLFRVTIGELEDEIIPEEPDPEPTPDPDPEEPTGGRFSVHVDVTLNEVPIDIVVPSDGGNDESGGEETPGDGEEGITISGDAINTDLIVNAPAGIEHFEVTIDSEVLTSEILEEVNLKSHFDLAEPGDLGNALKGLGFPVGAEVKGQTSVSFNISEFIPLIEGFPTKGKSSFILKITDKQGSTASKTVTVTTK